MQTRINQTTDLAVDARTQKIIERMKHPILPEQENDVVEAAAAYVTAAHAAEAHASTREAVNGDTEIQRAWIATERQFEQCEYAARRELVNAVDALLAARSKSSIQYPVRDEK